MRSRSLNEAKLADQTLAKTLIVATTYHDHTLSFNGYGKRGNPILDITRNYKDGQPLKGDDGNVCTTPAFGNGPNCPDLRPNLDSATVLADSYQQESGVRLASETHGGGDVKLLATGAGAKIFKGTLDNTKVFGLLFMSCCLALPGRSVLAAAQSKPGGAPDIDLSIKYYSRTMTAESVLRESCYEENMLRRPGHVRGARVLPEVAIAAHRGGRSLDKVAAQQHLLMASMRTSISITRWCHAM